MFKVGYAGFDAPTGLGTLSRQIEKYNDIPWLKVPHKHYNRGLKYDWNTFLDNVDAIVFCEVPHNIQDMREAKKRGKKLICVPMIEWLPARPNSWTSMVDLFVCPTRFCYETLEAEGHNAILFPWPIDTTEFRFSPRHSVKEFGYIHGNGGVNDRKGARIIKQLIKLWPDIPLKIFSRRTNHWKGYKNVFGHQEHPSDIYKHFDILLYPHRCDGIGLELNEALASGVNVVATDAPPWNERPLYYRLKCTFRRKRLARMVNWYEPDVSHLLEICQKSLGKNISAENTYCGSWAFRNSWTHNKLLKVIRNEYSVRS